MVQFSRSELPIRQRYAARTRKVQLLAIPLPFGFLALALSFSLFGAEAQDRRPQTASISQIKMLTPVEGYALMNRSESPIMDSDQLLWTADGGYRWENRTPPLLGSARIEAFCGLDGIHLWALLGMLNPQGDGEGSFSIALSSDSGHTWTELPFPVADRNLRSPGNGGDHMNFADPQHGWIELRLPTNTQWSEGGLFATSDGGKSWTRLPDPPVLDRMEFTSPQEGWLVGGAGTPRLFSTIDGGHHWRECTLPRPPLPAGYELTQLTLPHFSNGTGLLAAKYSKARPETVAWFSYGTPDGGKSWHILPGKIGIINEDSAFPVLLDSGFLEVYSTRDKIVTWRGGGRTSASWPVNLPGSFPAILSASFLDELHGWVIAFGADCGKPDACASGTVILATRDGGSSFADITPAR